MDKFSLIYEFNKVSPLLVYAASKELENLNFNKAIEILKTGLDHYKFYPTLYLQLSIAFAYTGNINEAKDMLGKADELINSDDTRKFYLNLIEKISREKNGTTETFENLVNQILAESFSQSEENTEDNIKKPEPIIVDLNTKKGEGADFTEKKIVTLEISNLSKYGCNSDFEIPVS